MRLHFVGAAVAALVLRLGPSLADTVVLSACGTETLTANTVVYTQSQDTTGRACVSNGGGSSGAVTQGSTTSGQSGQLVQGATVSGDQAYTAGTTNPLTTTASGRLRVGLSSAGGVTPGTAGTASDMVGGVYQSSPGTATDGQQRALQQDASGNLKTATQPTSVTTTDKSGTVTTGGAAQSPIALNLARKQWCIQNDPAATETLYVRVNGTAAAGVGSALSPGDQACSSGNFVDTAAVSVFAATTGHVFEGFEKQ